MDDACGVRHEVLYPTFDLTYATVSSILISTMLPMKIHLSEVLVQKIYFKVLIRKIY